MQGGQGRGGTRPPYSRRGGAGRGGGISSAAATGYPGMPGFVGHNWRGYNEYDVQGLLPLPATMRLPHARGSSTRPFTPLGVQGGGILKRPAVVTEGALMQGRRHTRGRGGRARGGRTPQNLTKEALDDDLDKWRMKDKKFCGQSLDADLDDYWKKKHGDGEAGKQDAEVKDEELETGKSSSKDPGLESPKKARAVAVVHDEESREQILLSPAD